ncbi:MAG: CHAT domain-containing protein, partial [Candidatus Promineifilaceae bacterium]
MNEKYTEIEIHIHPAAPGTNEYPIDARLDDDTPFQEKMRLDRTALLELDHLGDGVAYGLALAKALFSDQIGKAFEQVVGRANATAGGRVRVRLWIDRGAAELQAIRWERLYHQPTGQEVVLAADAKTPFSRFLGVSLPAAPAVSQRPIRLLLAIANPAGLPEGYHPVKVEQEVEALHKALGDLKESRIFAVTVMPGRSGLPASLRDKLKADGYEVKDGPTTLEALLRLSSDYHVLHFLGHGHFKRRGKSGPGVAHLHLENDQGDWQAIEDKELTAPLAAISPQPQLIFLAACESARTEASVEHPFVGLAQKLVAAGIPAVVAMQDLVGMDQARQLAGDFYWRLQRHGLVDRALNEARNLLWSPTDRGWSIPALFMRLKNGQLFIPSFRYGVAYDLLNPPDHYVVRPFITQNLREQLLTAQGAPAVSLLHGMPASGKTTLARALAQSVWDYFVDGVLWVTLGQQPEVLSLLGDLIQNLGDYDFRPTTVEGASQRLGSLLADKKVLLVLDDAWEYEDVAPFLVGGPRCHVLVTSRRSTVVGDQPFDYRLRVLTENQALEVLARLLGKTDESPFSEEEEAQARALVNIVGGHPLALELATGRIARGSSWEELTRALKAEIADLDALEPDARRRLKGNLRVEASINVSLDRLRQEFEPAWQNFVWLGALPEDATINPVAAAIWWGVKPGRAADILEYLYDENLLLEALEIQLGGKTWPAYKLHDLLHDVARRRLVADQPGGLGFTLQVANEKLLARYWQLTTDDLWYTLPADGYIQANLTWHMEQAGQIEAIHHLLAEETEDGRNGWYVALEQPDTGNTYATDVYRAWHLAEEAYEKQPNGLAIGRQCRYALIIASLSSLAGNLPPELLAALVQYKLWSPAKALAYVEQIPDAQRYQKAETLKRLAPLLPLKMLRPALV